MPAMGRSKAWWKSGSPVRLAVTTVVPWYAWSREMIFFLRGRPRRLL
jgi:hypothetical protein